MTLAHKFRAAEILLVEDSRGDVRLIEEALRDEPIEFNLHVAVDGDTALSFLRQEGGFGEAPRPDIIILDLNLPRRSGREVLMELKTGERFSHLRQIPVIILTTSSHEDDVLQCYENYANCYIVKPMNITSYSHVVNQINNYWFSTVQLPPH